MANGYGQGSGLGSNPNRRKPGQYANGSGQTTGQPNYSQGSGQNYDPYGRGSGTTGVAGADRPNVMSTMNQSAAPRTDYEKTRDASGNLLSYAADPVVTQESVVTEKPVVTAPPQTNDLGHNLATDDSGSALMENGHPLYEDESGNRYYRPMGSNRKVFIATAQNMNLQQHKDAVVNQPVAPRTDAEQQAHNLKVQRRNMDITTAVRNNTMTPEMFQGMDLDSQGVVRYAKEQELLKTFPGPQGAAQRAKALAAFMSSMQPPAPDLSMVPSAPATANTTNVYNQPSAPPVTPTPNVIDPSAHMPTTTTPPVTTPTTPTTPTTNVTTAPADIPMDVPVAAEAPVVQGAPDIQMPARTDFSDYMRYPLVEALTKGVTQPIPYVDEVMNRAAGGLDAVNPYDARMESIIQGQEAPINRKWDKARENLEHRFAVLNQLGSPALRAEMRELEEARASELGSIRSNFEMEAARNAEAMRTGRLSDLSNAITSRENLANQRMNMLQSGQQQEWQQGRQTGLDQERTAQMMNDQYRQYVDDYRKAYYHPLGWQDKGLAAALGGLGTLGSPIAAAGPALSGLGMYGNLGMNSAQAGQQMMTQFLTNPEVQNMFMSIFSKIPGLGGLGGGGGGGGETTTVNTNTPPVGGVGRDAHGYEYV